MHGRLVPVCRGGMRFQILVQGGGHAVGYSTASGCGQANGTEILTNGILLQKCVCLMRFILLWLFPAFGKMSCLFLQYGVRAEKIMPFEK